MSQEPTLILRLSNPMSFKCSACNGIHEGEFGAEGWVVDLIEAWHDHVRRCHPRSEATVGRAHEIFV